MIKVALSVGTQHLPLECFRDSEVYDPACLDAPKQGSPRSRSLIYAGNRHLCSNRWGKEMTQKHRFCLLRFQRNKPTAECCLSGGGSLVTLVFVVMFPSLNLGVFLFELFKMKSLPVKGKVIFAD
ncbi:hypothetical protein NPIL_318751 [Nephila pilipes]|uniref:Uncharacterized protein n=1 Tax=Nephila pilipes TaxID=299642 RepID=A0A8X6NJX7_NEPPI|nr:hypothetical protein NPIL_318751 [Nephila pilipes]